MLLCTQGVMSTNDFFAAQQLDVFPACSGGSPMASAPPPAESGGERSSCSPLPATGAGDANKWLPASRSRFCLQTKRLFSSRERERSRASPLSGEVFGALHAATLSARAALDLCCWYVLSRQKPSEAARVQRLCSSVRVGRRCTIAWRASRFGLEQECALCL